MQLPLHLQQIMANMEVSVVEDCPKSHSVLNVTVCSPQRSHSDHAPRRRPKRSATRNNSDPMFNLPSRWETGCSVKKVDRAPLLVQRHSCAASLKYAGQSLHGLVCAEKSLKTMQEKLPVFTDTRIGDQESLLDVLTMVLEESARVGHAC